jgi:hypothetical protein
MSDPSDDWLSDYFTKAGQARDSMWSAIANVFGFIISAASIVAAISKSPTPWLLLPLMVASFAGIWTLADLRGFGFHFPGFLINFQFRI